MLFFKDIIECMANSDNVIRVGLTPKLRDVDNLISGLTYTSCMPSRHMIKPSPWHDSKTTMLYDAPVPEFSVLQTILGRNGLQRTEFSSVDGPSIVIATKGDGHITWKDDTSPLQISTGDVIFIGAGTSVSFETQDSLVVYQAFA